MKTTLKAYLDSLDLTAEEKLLMEPLLKSEKVVSAIDKELAGAQTEISRRFDEAKKQNDKAVEYYTDLQNYKGNVDKQLEAAQKAVEEGKVLSTRVQERMRGLVASGELVEDDVKDLLSASAVNANPTPTTPTTPVVTTPDPKLVSREDFERTSQDLLNFAPALMGIMAKHQALYGKPPDAELISTLHIKALENKKGINAMADEVFKFSDRQKELDKLAADEKERTIRADERQKVMSEVSNPTHRPASANNSPVLQFSTPEKAEVDSQQHRARGVSAAVAAFSEGKYATKTA